MNLMHNEKVIVSGNTINATKALIMLHGRGGGAQDILSLAEHLKVDNYVLYAPQATNNTWYPYSFLAEPTQNEPWLGAALAVVGRTVDMIAERGIIPQNIYFTGFSQGACLMLEYLARHSDHYGGAAAFTGGLIGDKIYKENYHGNFKGMPIFIGTSNPDFHVPIERVYATANVLKEMGADVIEQVYDNIGHTIIEDEIIQANSLIFKTTP